MSSLRIESPSEPFVVAVVGTHSAGKSTLVQSFETGKLDDVLDEELLYEDFGYGLVEPPEESPATPVVIVPETALWCAKLSDQPDLLGKNWNLAFQLQVDGMYMLRSQAGIEIATRAVNKLVDTHPDFSDRDLTRPLVLTDRSVLEGLAYTRAHLPGQDTDIIGGFPRAAFHKKWIAQYVDVTVLTDHTEVPFQADPSRVDDLTFRNDVAEQVTQDYHSALPSERIRTIQGNKEQRKAALNSLIEQCI